MKRLVTCAIAAFLTVFTVSCGDEGNDTPSGNNTITDADNVVTIDEETIQLQSSVWFDDFGTAAFDAFNEGGQQQAHFGCGIAWESLGKTINLASAQANEDYWFRMEAYTGNRELEFTQRNTYGEVYSDINHEEGDETPAFSSGTLTTTRTNDGYTLVIDGTLKNGTAVLIKLKVAFDEEIVPLTRNSIIYDGVKYEFNVVSDALPDGSIRWSNTGSSDVSLAGHIYPGSNNLHADLNQMPTGDGYRFDFMMNVPGFQMDYEWNDATLRVNGEEVAAPPFTEGYAEMLTDNGRMSVVVIGTLTNGKVVKMRVSGTY